LGENLNLGTDEWADEAIEHGKHPREGNGIYRQLYLHGKGDSDQPLIR
jgi:hypothetical protein